MTRPYRVMCAGCGQDVPQDAPHCPRCAVSPPDEPDEPMTWRESVVLWVVLAGLAVAAGVAGVLGLWGEPQQSDE